MKTQAQLSNSASIANLISRMVGNARPGVRFGVVASKPGMGVSHASERISEAMGLHHHDLRMTSFIAGELPPTGPIGNDLAESLRTVGVPFLELRDCGGAPVEVVRDAIALAQSIDADGRGDPRPVLVLLLTTGPAADIIRIVRESTGFGPVGFLVLDQNGPLAGDTHPASLPRGH